MFQPTTDYTAALTSCALFDLSNRGCVELTGPEAVPFLHNLCTNDIKNLAVGHGCEFFLTTNKAKIVGHGFAHRLLKDSLWLDVDPGTGAKVTAHLNHFIVSEQVEVTDRSGDQPLFHVAGPQAFTKGEPLPDLAPLQQIVVNGLRMIRNDRLNLRGFDVVGSADFKTFIGAVDTCAKTFDALRIEAGIPVDGIDMDAERFVVEVGRMKQAICYTKGCYLGQEPIVMARDRGHANRALLGLTVDGETALAAGTKVLRGGEEVGVVTSSAASPAVGAVVALAYLKRGHQDAGTVVETEGRRALVTTLPFLRQVER